MSNPLSMQFQDIYQQTMWVRQGR